MKKILAAMLGFTLVSGAYAESFTMYAKADEQSSKLGEIDNQNPQYQAIFAKGNWVEVVDGKTSQVGWVNQSQPNIAQSKQDDSVDKMMVDFQNQQKMLDEHFNKVVADINNNVDQLAEQSTSTTDSNKPQVIKKFSSISINSNGKTAKIIEKTEDGSGKVKTVEKEVPASDLNSITFSN